MTRRSCWPWGSATKRGRHHELLEQIRARAIWVSTVRFWAPVWWWCTYPATVATIAAIATVAAGATVVVVAVVATVVIAVGTTVVIVSVVPVVCSTSATTAFVGVAVTTTVVVAISVAVATRSVVVVGGTGVDVDVDVDVGVVGVAAGVKRNGANITCVSSNWEGARKTERGARSGSSSSSSGGGGTFALLRSNASFACQSLCICTLIEH